MIRKFLWVVVTEITVVLAVVCAYFYMAINGLIGIVNRDVSDKMNEKVENWLGDNEE